MTGSGVTIVEARLLSRHAVGVDLDPLAVRIASAKTSDCDPFCLLEAGQQSLRTARRANRLHDPRQMLLSPFDQQTQHFIDYWFTGDTQRELLGLLSAIDSQPDPIIRRFLRVLFSSTIVTKSGGVSRALDLAHSRPHRVLDKPPRSALAMFESQLNKAVKAVQEIAPVPKATASALRSDCRSLPLASNSVDLIVTSPPYANAIDYMRAHKFSLVWFGRGVKELSSLRGNYIGSEKSQALDHFTLPEDVERSITYLESLDERKAQVLRKYFRDMRLALKEMHRVLKSNRAAVIVVGPSTMRGVRISTQEWLASIAQDLGFHVVDIARRSLDRNRRMMPVGFARNSESVIEQRIHEEFVIGLVKP
jgi:hypothetical protein